MPSLEPEIEGLLLEIVPDLEKHWKGATADQIEEIESLAGQPLPRFYRWFLETMGEDMGPLAYDKVDFSANRVLSCASESWRQPPAPYLFIGFNTYPEPFHWFYNLDKPARDDARLVIMDESFGARTAIAETFRERLAWGAMNRFRVEKYPWRCTGFLRDDLGLDVLGKLRPAMERLGFAKPMPAGSYCDVFHRPDAAMTCTVGLQFEPVAFVQFEHGAAELGTLRQTLGFIAKESGLEVRVDKWSSPQGG